MEPLLSTEEVSALLKISKTALWNYARKKQIPCCKIARRWKFSRAALDQWVEQHMQESNKTIKQ